MTNNHNHWVACDGVASVRALSKSYAERPVLSNIDCSIAPGIVFGLLGPNRA